MTCEKFFNIFVEITSVLKNFSFMVVCKECGLDFDNLGSLRRHRVQKHKISAEQTYVDYVLGGIKPTCECGCGEHTKFLSIEKGFVKFIRGHASRINNNWGHNPEAIKKSHNTQKQMRKDGKLSVWNKGLTIEDERVKNNIIKVMANPNRGKKISKKLIGVEKSDKHKKAIKIAADLRWGKPDEREKQSHRLIERLIKSNYRNKKTKLEIEFETILKSLGLEENKDYKYQYQISTAIFDFKLLKENILIEVDGDFHHCNPNSKHSIPVYPIQIKTVGNDIRKNRIAIDKNVKLLRFWETDIKTNKQFVIDTLRKVLDL